jgi:hypothetical protein
MRMGDVSITLTRDEGKLPREIRIKQDGLILYRVSETVADGQNDGA